MDAIQIFNLLTILSSLFPMLLFVLFIFIVRWIYIIKKNSEEQVKQNNELISLLKNRADEKLK